MGLFKFWFLHLKYKEDYEKKTNMDGLKNVNEPNKKKVFY